MFFRFTLPLIGLMLTGCSLSSGMIQPSESDVKNASGDTTKVEMIDISPAFILSQLKAQTPRIPSPEVTTSIPPHSHEYLIAPHDTLAITVWDHPELTMPAGANPPIELLGNIVRQDGSIFYPYAGIIFVAGKSVEDARVLIAEKLKHYIESPQVDVRVARYRSQFVYVTGEVSLPKTIALTNSPLDVIAAINEAGGLKSSADLSHIKLIHKNNNQENINLADLQTKGKLSENKFLRDGDHLFIPDSSNNIVFVTGEVKSPGSKQLGYQDYSLSRALSDAGGIDNTTANPSHIYVLRGFTEIQPHQIPNVYVKAYHLDAATPAGLILGNQFPLKAQDIVYVSSTEVTRWGRVMNNLASTIQALTLARLFK